MKRIGIIYNTLQASKGHHGTHLAFTGLPDTELILADPNPNPPCKGQIGAVRHYADYREMFEKEKLDGAAVCSRLPGDHYPVILEALKHGVHVLCEKPVSCELEETDELITLSESAHCLIAAAHLARYSKVFRTMKRCIESGMIGQPLTFYGRGKEDERGGGEDLIVLGTHIIDIGCMLFGMPETVSAQVYQNGHELRRGDLLPASEPVGPVAGDEIYARFRFPNGVNGVFESRRGLYQGKQVRMGVTVSGTKGTLSVRYDNDRFVRFSSSPYPPEDEAAYEVVPFDGIPAVPNAAPLRYEWFPLWYFAESNREAARNFLRAMDGGEPLGSDIYDVRNVLEIINGIYWSALEHRQIRFPLPIRKNPLA